MNKSLLRRIFNRLIASVARVAPGATTLRPFLHRLRGVKIHGEVFIGDDVYLENEYPECIELCEGAQIALRSIVIAHNRGPGKIIVGREVFIGTNCVIMASPGRTLVIGDGAVVMASCFVSSDVPPHTLVGSEKARPLATATVPLRIGMSYEEFLAGLRPLKR